MDKLRQRYIALQKAFWDSDGGAASVLALYEFKDELEKFDETEAKLVLVDVYELLGLKNSILYHIMMCDAEIVFHLLIYLSLRQRGVLRICDM